MMRTEFGSDFDFLLPVGHGGELPRESQLYACGRHALLNLLAKLRTDGRKRIYFPDYFCFDVVDAVAQSGFETAFYPDLPGTDEEPALSALPLTEEDILLRCNYFGTRGRRDNSGIAATVIEDHSHDLLSGWAGKSNADYCIASLRKTLPLPEGGLLYSPKGLRLPQEPAAIEENEQLDALRFLAMAEKSSYMYDGSGDKERFRRRFAGTETQLAASGISRLGAISTALLRTVNITELYERKRRNWRILAEQLNGVRNILSGGETGTPFSLVLLLDSLSERETLKRKLIDNKIYPAILWTLPEQVSPEALDFSRRMLSLHCDFRYSEEEICYMAEIVRNA